MLGGKRQSELRVDQGEATEAELTMLAACQIVLWCGISKFLATKYSSEARKSELVSPVAPFSISYSSALVATMAKNEKNLR
jgi:hypothetical protein